MFNNKVLEVISKDFVVKLPKEYKVFGNRNSNNTIVLLIRPSCEHCFKAVKELINLVYLNDDFKLIIFIKSENYNADFDFFNRIENFFFEKDTNSILEIISEWKSSNGKELKKPKVKLYSKLQQSSEEFFYLNKIESFPMIIINDKELPGFVDPIQIKVCYSKY